MIVRILKSIPGRKWKVGETPDLAQSYARQLITNKYAEDASHLPRETIPEKPKEEQVVHVVHHNATDISQDEEE